MARAYQQSQPTAFERDAAPGDWQSLRQELAALLDQVDSQVTRGQPPASRRPATYESAEYENDLRHRDALKSVQRAITRFGEPVAERPAPPAQPMPPNPRDSLQSAINQIRSSQRAAAPQAAPPRPTEAPLIDKLAQSVNGLAGRLERLETEIRAQIKTGANVKDVADQVAQLANVVELLAGAVGETGQVKRLEGQIASLGKIMSQGREMDIQTLTRRLDDVASTVGKLAELQVHYADRVQNPVESQAFQDGMRSIEDSVRNVYDRIDALERHASLTPQDLEHVTAEMARFTAALSDGAHGPDNLVELVDALNARISEIETGDRMLVGLRSDLDDLRDALTGAIAPRFDAIEQRMESLSTREDMAEIGRQIGMLGDRFNDRPADVGIGQIEAQVRQLVARMDQTGEQLSHLSSLYSNDSAPQPDFEAMAEMVATRAAEAVQRTAPAPAVVGSLDGLESRIAAMLETMRRDPEVDGFDSVQSGISEVNERLKRLEQSLLARHADIATDTVPATDISAIIAAAEQEMPVRRPRPDAMPQPPADDAPLTAQPFPEPVGPVAAALEAKSNSRKLHPGLHDDDLSLAARHDAEPKAAPKAEPKAEAMPPRFDPDKVTLPAAPQPSAGFAVDEAEPSAPEPLPVSASSRNTFIEAARRAAQRQTPRKPESVAADSLIGRAMARLQSVTGDLPGAAKPDVAKSDAKAETPKAKKSVPAKKRFLAGDKPARTFKPEPVEPLVTEAVAAPAHSAEAEPAVDGAAPATDAKESFLSRNRKTVLLGAAVVALAFLTINLVAQKLAADPAETAAPEPATTGDIGQVEGIAPALGDLAASMPARVIPMATDSLNTGSIDQPAAQGFSATPQAMPSAFALPEAFSVTEPTEPTAPVATIAPLVPAVDSPVKVELPPENVGPMDLRQAAANGDPRAQFEVAAIYTEGRAVPQDFKAAAVWYERAAAQGFAPAQYRIGNLYENGQGVDKDLNTAKLWYERAAEAGNRMSMHNLAALYAGGQLGKQQFDSAAKWFEEAANRGLTDSQFNLGMLYARGLGVPQSLQDSYKWFGIAAESGDKDSAKARDDIARSLDADTMAKLTAEIKAFKPEPIDLPANFAPIGTWTKSFDPGETIATHDIVASVQTLLDKLGYDAGTPDGIAGKKTSDAIKAFEGAIGMNEIGLVNPRLLAVLGSQPV